MGEIPGGGAMPDLPAPPKKGRSGLLKTVGIPLVTFLVGIGIGVAAAPDDGKTPVAAPAESPSESVEGSDSPSPSPPATTVEETTTTVEETTEPPNLDGTWVVTSCDLQLFTQGFNTSTLVGAVKVENTGNVPALVTVSLKWDALPGPLFDGGTKEVTLNPGASREIRFTEKINGSDVDRVQSSPGYKAASENKFCNVRASIAEA